ncbi:hypothetical protein [uncultured Chryseobacterium sp.]|uniref:hypothetical protein n=1 Tax=uncultured Chryseobacterium sp. TaxID=259322 RepID=UPI0025EB8AE9|nr:hypothetical protein [uncultured Chryseobacterium sp.]
MKMNAMVAESPIPGEKTMVLRFRDDAKKQHFEVRCHFEPYLHKFRKWDDIIVWIKWESEIFEEPKTGQKSYFTHLTCHKATLVHTPYTKEKSLYSLGG